MNISKVLDTVRMGLISLIGHKTRAILTILGITIGVMTVVGLTSLIEGLNSLVAGEFGKVGTTGFTLSRNNFAVHSQQQWIEENKRPDLTLEDAKVIAERCPSIEYVSPRLRSGSSISYGGKRVDDNPVVGGNEHYQIVQGAEITGGRFFSNAEVEHKRYVAVLGSETAESFFPHEDPVGEYIKVGNRSFLIIGVLGKMGQTFGRSNDNIVVIPITLFAQLYNKRMHRLMIQVKAKDEKSVPAAIEEVQRIMRERRKLRFEDEDNFTINTPDSLMSSYKQLTGVVFAAMIGVGLISLIVGGVGIMNIMLVSVTERTKEIGIRMALGAKRSDILLQFLMESSTLALIGGIAGIAFGFLISIVIRLAADLPASVPFWSILLAIGFSASIGVVFGLYPAWRAAKSDPIVALRYE